MIVGQSYLQASTWAEVIFSYQFLDLSSVNYYLIYYRNQNSYKDFYW